MSETVSIVVSTQQEAHQAATQLYAHAKTLIANGEQAAMSVGEALDEISSKQRRFFHGPVLTQISEQVRVAGERYTIDIWKEFFRQLFLPDKWVMSRRPRIDPLTRKLVKPKRATPLRVRRSTEDLGVKGYSELIDKVLAHAATELGVEFVFINEEREAVRYKPPARKAKAKETAEA
jgi:hypothetical protein